MLASVYEERSVQPSLLELYASTTGKNVVTHAASAEGRSPLSLISLKESHEGGAFYKDKNLRSLRASSGLTELHQ